MAKMDKQVVEWIRKFDKLKRTARNIEGILLSFRVLLNNLTEERNDKAQLRILRGPILSPTRRKLQKLNDEFDRLGTNLADAYSFFNRFMREPRGDFNNYDMVTLYNNYKSKNEYWEKNEKRATVYTNNLLAKLTPNDHGRFYHEIKRGANVAPEEITKLKEEVDGFLVIIRVLKE